MAAARRSTTPATSYSPSRIFRRIVLTEVDEKQTPGFAKCPKSSLRRVSTGAIQKIDRLGEARPGRLQRPTGKDFRRRGAASVIWVVAVDERHQRACVGENHNGPR